MKKVNSLPTSPITVTNGSVSVTYCMKCVEVGKEFTFFMKVHNNESSTITQLKVYIKAYKPDGKVVDNWITLNVFIPPNGTWEGKVNSGITLDEAGTWIFQIKVFKPWFFIFQKEIGSLYICPNAPVMGDRYCLSIFAFRKSDSKKLYSRPPDLKLGESLIIRGWVLRIGYSGPVKHCDIPIYGKTVCAYLDNHRCTVYTRSDDKYMFKLVVTPTKDMFDGRIHYLTIYVVQDPKAKQVFKVRLLGNHPVKRPISTPKPTASPKPKVSVSIESIYGVVVASLIASILALRYLGKI